MSRPDRPPFHIALAVRDLETSREFYGGLLGCSEGRSAQTWVDFDFFGHQLVCHRTPGGGRPPHRQLVDGTEVPVPHCGVVLSMDRWQGLAEVFRAENYPFAVAPRVRFAGQVGEQGTFFVEDPSANLLEFKGFSDLSQLFAR